MLSCLASTCHAPRLDKSFRGRKPRDPNSHFFNLQKAKDGPLNTQSNIIECQICEMPVNNNCSSFLLLVFAVVAVVVVVGGGGGGAVVVMVVPAVADFWYGNTPRNSRIIRNYLADVFGRVA